MFYLTSILIGIVFVTTVFGQDRQTGSNSDDYAQIEELHKKDMKAAKEGDFETLSSLMTDDCIIIPPNEEPLRGKKTIQENLKKQLEQQKNYKVTEYIHSFEEVKIIGEWAYEWGAYRGTVVPAAGGEPITESGKLFRILKRQPDGSWKVARAIWNVDILKQL